MILILMALTLLVAVWVFPKLWLTVVRNRIDVKVQFSPTLVVVGQLVQIHCWIRNRSWFPCPFVEVSIELPPGLSSNPNIKNRMIRYTTYLQGRQEMRLAASCYTVSRGHQDLCHHPAVVKLNEGLGLTLLTLSRAQSGHITVMPAIGASTVRQPELREIFGRIEQFHWFQPDESLFRGIREYQPGDPLKYMSWQASAAHGRWMVKEFSASSETTVCLMLNAQMFANFWSGTRRGEFDRLCEMVAGYAIYLHRRGFQLKFSTNAIFFGNSGLSFFGVQSAASVRAILGELEPYAAKDFSLLLEEYRKTTSSGETLLIFTSYHSMSWESHIAQIRRNGCQVEMVLGPDPVVEKTGFQSRMEMTQ